MTNNEIKKALECCLIGECESCPISKFSDCYETLKDEAMSLVNRQQAVIEQLKSLCTSKDVIIKGQEAEIERLKGWQDLLKAEKHSLIKAEAIKEFAAKLKCGISITSGVITCADIDDLLAEMVGGENA